MSKADDMFEELGYKLLEDDDKEILIVYKDKNIYIVFYKDKTVGMFCEEDEYLGVIDMQDLKAINEKVKELGWLDE